MNETIKNSISCLFLSLLFTLVLLNVIEHFWPKSVSPYLSMTYLSIIVLVLTVLTFYYNREIINNVKEEIDEGRNKELILEENRKKEFPDKFQKINKIPILRNIVKWIYKEGRGYVLVLIGIYIIFTTIQIYKIYHAGIGTDEGNFLYVTKLLFQGKVLYLDFWARESGSLIFLVPWFKMFETSIMNLRWLIFIINSLIFTLFFILMKKLFKNKKAIYITFSLSVLLLSFIGVLDVYPAIFYQLFNLFAISILYFMLRYYGSIKYEIIFMLIIGLLTGLSIIIYKGAQSFLVLSAVLSFCKLKNNVKKYILNTLSFFLASSIPVLFYWFYYSISTNWGIIYNVILGDVLMNLIIIIFIFIFLAPFILLISNKSRSFINTDNLILLSNLLILGVIIYRVLQNKELLSSSFYSGLILNYSFLIISLQLLNLTICNKYRKVLIFIYLLINGYFVYTGFGARGFFTQAPLYYHIFATVIIGLYNLFLLGLLTKYNFIESDNLESTNHFYIIILLLNLYFVINILGGSITPNRFGSLLIFLPILFYLISVLQIRRIKWLVYLIIFSALIFSFYINTTLQNDYTLYSLNDFKESVNYINNNLDKSAIVFSTDTAILSEIGNPSLISFYSPWQFISESQLDYYDYIDSLNIKTDLGLKQEDLSEKIKNTKPKYIVGAGRTTFRYEKEQSWKNILDNYRLMKKFGRIQIYEIKS